MTVPVPSTLTFEHIEDGVTTVFSYPVRFLEASELLVIREAAGGTRTTLIYNSDYTVSGAGNDNGGSITRTAVTSGGKIIIGRRTASKQLVDLKDAQRNPAEAVELQLDRLAMAIQDDGERVGAIEAKTDAIDQAVLNAANSAAAAAESEANTAADAEEAKAARDEALSAQPQAFPVNRAGLAGLPDTTANAYLKEPGFEGYFKQVDNSGGGYDALIAADTVGGEVKVSTANPDLAYLRQRKNGDYFKSSEAGGDLAVAFGLAAQRVALGDVSKATIEINERGTKVLASGLIVPDKVELVGMGSDTSVLNLDDVAAADLIQIPGLVSNCGFLVRGAGLTDLGLGFDDIAVDDVSINFASAPPLKPGDVLSLYRPAFYSFGIWNGVASWASYRSEYRAGQRVGVVAVEGTRVWLDDRARHIYKPASAGAQYATTIYKQARRGGRFGGFSLEMPLSTVSDAEMVLFHQLNEAVVEDIKAIGGARSGVSFKQCFDMNPRRIHANTQIRSVFSGIDYAMMISNSTRLKISDSVGTGNWAGSSFGGGSSLGDSASIACGFEDCTLTAKHSDAAGMHGNTMDCGYNRCVINGPAELAGDNPYVTNCDVRCVDNDGVIAIYAWEMRGGLYDISGTKIFSTKDAGGYTTPRGCIDINRGSGNDTYAEREILFFGRSVSLNAPNETQPVASYRGTNNKSIAIDLEFSYLNVPSTGSLGLVYSTQASGGSFSPASCHRVAAYNLPAGVPFATFANGYTAKSYKYPTQSIDLTFTLAGGTTADSGSVSFANPYPVAPSISLGPIPRNGTDIMSINAYNTTTPSYASFRAILSRVGGNLPASGTYTTKATVFF